MFTSDEKINLRLAKKFAENVAEVLLQDWENKDFSKKMLLIAQDKSIEIAGEKARQSRRLLRRYVYGPDWKLLIDENVSYSHPGEEGTPSRTSEEKGYILASFAGYIEHVLEIKKIFLELIGNRLKTWQTGYRFLAI